LNPEDDIPLYSTAKRYGKLVVTSDTNLPEKRDLWLRELGVETVTVKEALESASEEEGS
jgi:hypothetical protein